jgi:hypothetical protein
VVSHVLCPTAAWTRNGDMEPPYQLVVCWVSDLSSNAPELRQQFTDAKDRSQVPPGSTCGRVKVGAELTPPCLGN